MAGNPSHELLHPEIQQGSAALPAMSEELSGWDVHVLPCVLQHRLKQFKAKSPYGDLSEPSSREAFQNWVTHVRPLVSDVSELCMCPLLWCRNRFESQASTVCHTSTCPWLPNACYWCPQCKKPERFWSSGNTREAIPSQLMIPSQMMRRKSSRMRKAKAFFNHFSRKSAKAKSNPLNGHISNTSGQYRKPEMDPRSRQMCEVHAEGITTEKCGPEIFEVFGSEPYQESIPELEGSATEKLTMSDMLRPRSVYELQSPNEAELRAELCSGENLWVQAELRTPNPNHELPVTPDSSTERSESSQRRRHLCCSSCSHLARAASTTLLSNQSPALDSIDASVPKRCCDSDIQPHPPFPSHLASCRLMASLPESPSSRTQMEFPQSMQPAQPLCAQPNKAFHPVHSGSISQEYAVSAKDSLSLAYIFGDILANDASWPVRNDRWSLRGGLAPTQEHVQELCDLVTVVNNEWLQRLTSTPHLYSRCSALAPAAIFYRGIRAMENLFKDTFVSDFEDVFSLMHVACACAYMLHKDDKFYDWDEFFNHMFQWQHVFSDGDDLQCFLMAMDQLACEESSHLTNCLGVTGKSDKIMQEKILRLLRDGPIMKDCSTFVDNIEHASIPERNQGLIPEHLAWYALSHAPIIQEMLETIIEPLKCEAGIEAFHENAVQVQFQLCAGLLRNPREVEVTLKSSGRYDSQSQQVLQRFQEAVSTFCDRAMHQTSPSWRNSYYVAALDKVLAVSAEITKRQTREAQPNKKSGTSVLAVVRPTQSNCSSPITAASVESRTLVNLSPSTVGSRSSQQSSLMENYESPSTAPSSDSTDSPTSPLSTSAAAMVLSCPSCPKKFRGISAATNLQRHLNTTRAHGKIAIFSCRKDGCDRRYSRSDNLTAHILKNHGEPAPGPSKRRGQRKRRRELDDVLEQDESLFRPEKTFLLADVHREQGRS